MPGPELAAVTLTDEERLALELLVRRRTVGQQLALRGRIILAAADGVNQSMIAAQLGTTINTVRYWRRRWLGLQPIALTETLGVKFNEKRDTWSGMRPQGPLCSVARPVATRSPCWSRKWDLSMDLEGRSTASSYLVDTRMEFHTKR